MKATVASSTLPRTMTVVCLISWLNRTDINYGTRFIHFVVVKIINKFNYYLRDIWCLPNGVYEFMTNRQILTH